MACRRPSGAQGAEGIWLEVHYRIRTRVARKLHEELTTRRTSNEMDEGYADSKTNETVWSWLATTFDLSDESCKRSPNTSRARPRALNYVYFSTDPYPSRLQLRATAPNGSPRDNPAPPAHPAARRPAAHHIAPHPANLPTVYTCNVTLQCFGLH